MRPMTHELAHVWITGDGRYFLSEKEAKKHQSKLERLEELDGDNKEEL